MLMRAAVVAFFFAACALALCEQGTSFDPDLKLIVNAVQMNESLPRARALLGRPALVDICNSLENATIFQCVAAWSDGIAGYAMSAASVTAEAQKRLPKAADGIVFGLSTDLYYQNPVGLRSPPKDRAPRCTRSPERRRLAQAEGAPAPAPPPVLGKDGVSTQSEAPDTLSFMSSFTGNRTRQCWPGCQEPLQFRYAATGKNVTVYVVDQAVANHTDLGASLSAERYYAPAAEDNAGQPCASWHGTHVAGLVAGSVHGVAKDATIVSVAVQPGCNGDGRTSDLIAGLDWVLERHERVGGPAVVSMSLIVTSSAAGAVLESQVRDLLADGVIVVVAAGNFADDSCNYMPANLEGVITVAAAQLDTSRGISYASPWASSNIGKCVTLWAPGAYVTSDSSDSPVATAVYSGTSQATPMVSGLVAQFLERKPAATPDDVIAHLKANSYEVLTRVPVDTAAIVAQVALD